MEPLAQNDVKKTAFTLAEVLITLGIIGVVAAMTLPALIAGYKKRTIETRIKRFYSVINQAVMLSENTNGSRMDWSKECLFPNCKPYFEKYFSPYLKTLKWYENGDGFIIIYFADGSLSAMKSGYDWFFYPFAKDYERSKLTALNDKNEIVREDCGKTYWAFQFTPAYTDQGHQLHYNKGVEPYRAMPLPPGQTPDADFYEYSRERLLNHPTMGCNKRANYKVYCTALIQENNWQFPDDYPLKF